MTDHISSPPAAEEMDDLLCGIHGDQIASVILFGFDQPERCRECRCWHYGRCHHLRVTKDYPIKRGKVIVVDCGGKHRKAKNP